MQNRLYVRLNFRLLYCPIIAQYLKIHIFNYRNDENKNQNWNDLFYALTLLNCIQNIIIEENIHQEICNRINDPSKQVNRNESGCGFPDQIQHISIIFYYFADTEFFLFIFSRHIVSNLPKIGDISCILCICDIR